MEKRLIGRGVLAGAIGGVLAFVFDRIFTEPVIDKAIAYESARDAAQDALDKAAGVALPAAGPDIFSRTIQADVGIGVGLILFGAAMGALVAVAYVICIGRTGRIRPRQLAMLVAGAGFTAIFMVPFVKYPANPPAIGHEDTIRQRGALYLILVFVSCLLLFLVVLLGQRLQARFGNWNAVLLAATTYAVGMAIVMLVLPQLGHLHYNLVHYGRHATETPLPLKGPDGKIVFPGFPADVLASFRLYAVIAQAIVWTTIALVFGPLAQRVLEPAAKEADARETVPA